MDGWITQTRPNTTGSLVKKDETLAAFYSTEFLSAGQALLFALRSKDRLRPTGDEPEFQKDQIAQFELNLQQYKDSLKNLGMGDLQIAEMARTRRYMENVNITSPADGFILSRKVSPGLRFEKGWEFYRIADLSRVWVLADVYEQEAEAFQPGAEAKVTLPYKKKSFIGKVSQVLPVFEPTTRTLQVRIELDNPGFVMRPDMFADVELPVEYPAAIYVPTDAVLDSGLRQTVFVLRERGFFEPREVTVGKRVGGQVEITEGLSEGEQIVVSGNFLVDSESKLQMVASGMQAVFAKDPVCGKEVSIRARLKSKGYASAMQAPATISARTSTRSQFETNPGRTSHHPNDLNAGFAETGFMINRIIDFSVENKFIVFALAAVPALRAGGRCGTCRSTPSRT